MMARFRCAIYTRKSTDDGLEQEFNSLDAQREACDAFIKSQRGLGWIALAARYDDGGVSGGTMDRPALQSLLADIETSKVDLIVVYKVDRLTRSLADFGKLVEVFDARGVSFVSVTQQFNTTTSMGRLTLNMLLSFAQFEREVTGERIRDKIAASKKKGMWMGGLPPLGYDAKDKKLVVNNFEAETVRALFRLYLDLGAVMRLLEESHRRGLVTKRRRHASGREAGGRPFTRGHLHQLLTNPIYVGDIAHKGLAYPGQHKAIIEREIFDAVRRHMDGNAAKRHSATNARAPSLLNGLVFDEIGDRLCPTHASKKGRRYRYYISKRLMHRTGSTDGGWRLPASELEGAVTRTASEFLTDERRVIDALIMNGLAPDELRTFLVRAAAAARDLIDDRPERHLQLLHLLLYRVTHGAGTRRLELRRTGLWCLVTGADAENPAQSDGLMDVTVPIALRRRGVEAKLVLRPAEGGAAAPDQNLIKLIARAHDWLDQLTAGECGSVREIARREDIDESDVSRFLPLAFLAPDIVESVMAGKHPPELTAEKLKRLRFHSQDWQAQRESLGFHA